MDADANGGSNFFKKVIVIKKIRNLIDTIDSHIITT